MTALASFLTGVVAGAILDRALSRNRVRKLEAQADELRFLLAPVVQHSVEDAARRAGC